MIASQLGDTTKNILAPLKHKNLLRTLSNQHFVFLRYIQWVISHHGASKSMRAHEMALYARPYITSKAAYASKTTNDMAEAGNIIKY